MKAAAENTTARHRRELADDWRERLQSVSWFMRCLNEHIARRANKEDECKGRFWEGRFKSQPLLDEDALLTCMAYVDLNPIRSGKALSLEESEHTSIASRLEYAEVALEDPDTKVVPPRLAPFEDQVAPRSKRDNIPMSFLDYVELLEWTGRCQRAYGPAGTIRGQAPTLLQKLQLDPDAWLRVMEHQGLRTLGVLGSVEKLDEFAEAHGKPWVHGKGLARAMTRQPAELDRVGLCYSLGWSFLPLDPYDRMTTHCSRPVLLFGFAAVAFLGCESCEDAAERPSAVDEPAAESLFAEDEDEFAEMERALQPVEGAIGALERRMHRGWQSEGPDADDIEFAMINGVTLGSSDSGFVRVFEGEPRRIVIIVRIADPDTGILASMAESVREEFARELVAQLDEQYPAMDEELAVGFRNSQRYHSSVRRSPGGEMRFAHGHDAALALLSNLMGAETNALARIAMSEERSGVLRALPHAPIRFQLSVEEASNVALELQITPSEPGGTLVLCSGIERVSDCDEQTPADDNIDEPGRLWQGYQLDPGEYTVLAIPFSETPPDPAYRLRVLPYAPD